VIEYDWVDDEDVVRHEVERNELLVPALAPVG